MSAIERHPSLINLDLGYSPSTKVLGSAANQISDFGVESIVQMLDRNDKLQQLDLPRTDITDRGKDLLLAALENNRSIRELRLDGRNERLKTLLDPRTSAAQISTYVKLIIYSLPNLMKIFSTALTRLLQLS